MTNNDAVAADELRIVVEMGDDFTPSEELQGALDNVLSVLEDQSSEVQGFGWDEGVAAVRAPLKPRSFSVSINYENIEFHHGYTENDSKGKKVI